MDYNDLKLSSCFISLWLQKKDYGIYDPYQKNLRDI